MRAGTQKLKISWWGYNIYDELFHGYYSNNTLLGLVGLCPTFEGFGGATCLMGSAATALLASILAVMT